MYLQAVVDRFEGDKAVLLLDGGGVAVVWPRALLPGNVREGDVLAVTLAVDAAATEAAQQEAVKLLGNLRPDGR
jgi:hypothetical protein